MLYASFRRPDGIFAGCFNRFAASVTGGDFCHSEFIFRLDNARLKEIIKGTPYEHSALKLQKTDTVYVAWYTMWGGQVTYRILTTYAPDSFWRLPVDLGVCTDCTPDQETEIFRWCISQARKPYDRAGALGCIFPLRGKQDEYSQYFCSQFMACALNRVGLLVGPRGSPNPGGITPNNLYLMLT